MINTLRRLKRVAHKIGLLFILIGTIFWSGTSFRPAHALTAGQVSLTLITPIAVIDANAPCKSATGASGPSGMYLQVDLTNTSGGTLTGVNATLVFTTPKADAYGFQLGTGENPVRQIGTMANGAVDHLFWYIDQPCLAVATAN